jgi:hypothetical protein
VKKRQLQVPVVGRVATPAALAQAKRGTVERVKKRLGIATDLASGTKAIGFALAGAAIPQFLVVAAFALFDDQVKTFHEGVAVWYSHGGAVALALGLLAAGITDTFLRSAEPGKTHLFVVAVGVAVIAWVAAKHGDLLQGTTPAPGKAAASANVAQGAKHVSAAIIVIAVVLAGVAAFTNARSEKKKNKSAEGTS